MTKLILPAILLFAVAVAGAQEPKPATPAAPAAPAGNAEAGKKLWTAIGCWQCHGYEAQGGAAGPRLASRNLAWGVFSAYVRRPTNLMPPYTDKVLSTADLAHIYVYVISRPAPTPVANIQLLQK